MLVCLGVTAAIALAANGSCQGARASEIDIDATVCELELADPAFASNPSRPYKVVRHKDRRGFTVGYALSLSTPVCMDGKCRLVELTMHFNAIGYYERLECPPDKPLTKNEHTLFLPEDYAKLDRILKDRNSLHRNHSLAFLVEHSENLEPESQSVDGVTAATPITMRESVVQGAAYTTWVLWQWANGPLTSRLQAMTAADCAPAHLKRLLRHSNRDHVDFALKHVAKRFARDAHYVEAMLHLLENGDRQHVPQALAFLRTAIPDRDQRHSRLIKSFARMRHGRSQMILKDLAAEKELPEETLVKLTEMLGQLPYYHVHLILNMLEKHACRSPKALANVAQLLENENFFIARRAFEHLLKRELTDEISAKVDEFHEKNKERL